MTPAPDPLPGAALPLSPRELAAAFLIGLAGFSLCYAHHVWWTRANPPVLPTIDETADLGRASRILKGERAAEPFYQSPLYPYFLALVSRGIGPHPDTPRVIQFVLAGATAVIAFLLGRGLHSTPAGLAAGLLVALSPPLVFASRQHEKSLLSVFLVALALHAYVRARAAGSPLAMGFAGLVTGIGCLARDNLLLFIPLFGLWPLLAALPWRRRFFNSGAFLAAAVLPVLPVTLHNARHGSFVPTTWQAGSNFYSGNHSGNTLGGYARPPFVQGGEGEISGSDWKREAERRAGRPLSHAEVSSFWLREGASEILLAPARAVRLLAKKLLLFWNRYEVPDTLDLQFLARTDPFLRWPLPGFAALAVLAPAGLVLLARAPAARPLAAYVLVSWLTVSAFFVLGRYRLTLYVPLAVGAGMALSELARCAARGRWRPLLAFALALLAGAWLAFRPVERLGDGDSWFRLGVAHASRGQPDLAVGALELALAANPRDEQTLFHLGESLFKLGRYDDAVRMFRRATEANPHSAQYHNSLGVAYYELADYPRAHHHLMEATRLMPDRLENWRNLAILLDRTGDHDQAVHAARVAIRLAVEDVHLRRLVADNLFALRRWQEAAEAYQQLRHLNPWVLPAFVQEARCWLALGRPEKVPPLVDLLRRLFPKPQAERAVELIEGFRKKPG